MSAAQRPRWRDQVVTAVVAGISALYGVALIQSSQLVIDLTGADGGDVSTARATIMITAAIFIGLGAYSAAVVTANSFATIVAGRVREIAQYRLLGASAVSLRRRLAAEGLGAGLIGVVLGAVLGLGGYVAVLQWQLASGSLPGALGDYTLVSPFNAIPALMSVATVAIAAWWGTAPVSRVSPVQALSASLEAPLDLSRTPVAQRVLALLGLGGGAVLLVGGAALGAVSPMGLPVAFLGGIASFTGFVIGARMLVPRLLRGFGRLFGRGVPARLASANATRSPRAATRGTIGMIVGVTLVVMFVVAVAITRVVLVDYGAAAEDPSVIELVNVVLDVLTMITVGLVGVSAVIGAAGMIAGLALAVLQRQRELGLLRAVGATAAQVRGSIGIEAVLTSLVAIGTGFVLGVFYGWVGAQATLGAVAGMAAGAGAGIVPLVVPWWLLAAVAGAAIALAAVTALGPAMRATRVTPIQALAVQ